MSDDSSKGLEKSRSTWSPRAAVLVTVGAFLGAQYVVAILLSFSGLGQTLLNSVTGQFIFVAASDVIILAAVWLFLRHRHINIRDLGFRRRPALLDAGYAVVAFVVYFFLLLVATNALSQLVGLDVNQKQQLGFDNLYTASEKIMALISLVILPPLVEETVFRGFLFGGLRSKLSFRGAALITSVIFAAPHLLASDQGLLWVAGVDTFILSLVLCYLRERTGALWAPMIVHALKNSLAFVFLLYGFGFL